MKNYIKIISIILVLTSLALTSCKKEYKLFVGGFTTKDGEKGMSVFNFNAGNGKLKLISESDVGPKPLLFLFF